ncbi:MAG: hypothetical protein AAF591_01585 [Verrucomicrobiota bacterium]
MKRRAFLSQIGTVSAAGLSWASLPHTARSADKPARTSSDPASREKTPLLFWDLWKLDAWNNLEHVQEQATYRPEGDFAPRLDSGKGPSKTFVYRDQETGRWRMIYNMGYSPVILMTAESNDGINWTPESHPEIEVSGPKWSPNHIFSLADTAMGGIFHDPVAADGLPFKAFAHQSGDTVLNEILANPDHHWHSIAKNEGPKKYFKSGIMLASSDGIEWQAKPDYRWDQPHWQPEPYFFGYHHPPTNSFGMTVRPGWGDRRVAVQFSPDFKSWSDPELLLQMDPLDVEGPVGFYGMPVFPVGNAYVGLLWVFHNSSSKRLESFNQFFGTMDCQLAYSYDGKRFVRGKRHPLIPLNPSGAFGSAQIRAFSLVETDDEIRIYAASSMAPHGLERTHQKKSPEPVSAVTLHTLRKDGFYSLQSRGDWATFLTKPLTIFSPNLSLNADAAHGTIQYQVTDHESHPVEGFTFDDCIPIEGEDSITSPLQWKNQDSLNPIVGKAVRLEFRFQNARIYALYADYHFLDAQDKWLLLDNKDIDRNRFDF